MHKSILSALRPNTRRQFLKATGATVAVAAVTIPTAAKADDPELLALVADFWPAYREYETAQQDSRERREKTEAMPDYPPYPWPFKGTPEFEKWEAARQRCEDATGFTGTYEKWIAALNRAREIAGNIFAIPALTVRCAYEKIKIVRLVTGTGAETGDGDADLSSYQDYDAPWIDNAIADLERLGGAA